MCYLVKDLTNPTSDGVELKRLHVKRCIIIPAWVPDCFSEIVSIESDDIIICADGGYLAAQREGIIPQLIIGDFDSMPMDAVDCCNINIQKAAVEKDETDTFLCMQKGIELGCSHFLLVGGFGGRWDHTLAHFQIMAWATRRGFDFEIRGIGNSVSMMLPGERELVRQEGYKLSILAYGGKAEGVTLSNVKYPLCDAILSDDYPLGISNEFLHGNAYISFKSGLLLIFLSKD